MLLMNEIEADGINGRLTHIDGRHFCLRIQPVGEIPKTV